MSSTRWVYHLLTMQRSICLFLRWHDAYSWLAFAYEATLMFLLQLMDSKKALLERDGTPHFYVKILASLEDALQTQITKVRV